MKFVHKFSLHLLVFEIVMKNFVQHLRRMFHWRTFRKSRASPTCPLDVFLVPGKSPRNQRHSLGEYCGRFRKNLGVPSEIVFTVTSRNAETLGRHG